MLMACLLGILIGFFLSIPIGPINLMVINEAFRKGFWRAFLVGIGGVAGDMLYCAMAFLGFSSFADQANEVAPFLKVASGLLILGCGIRYLKVDHTHLTPKEKKTESKLSHFRKAFPVGFFMAMSNPGLLILWGIVYTLIVSNHLFNPSGLEILIFVISGGIGSSCWFGFVAMQVSRSHHMFNAKTLQLIARISGVVLMGFGLFLCGRSFMDLQTEWFRKWS